MHAEGRVPSRPRLVCTGWDASVAPGNSLLGAFCSLEPASFHRMYTPTRVGVLKRYMYLLLESGSEWGETEDRLVS